VGRGCSQASSNWILTNQGLAAMREKSRHLTFRLPAPLARLLVERGRTLDLSPGQLSRLFVVQALTDSHTAQLTEEVANLQREVAGLREQTRALEERILLAVEALLVDAGQVEPDEAAEWVRTNLLHQSGSGRQRGSS
jgi:hypothetical protein